MRPSAAILDGEMEHQNGEIGHQNKEIEHQNGEMDWFEYTPGCKKGIQPPGCSSNTTRILRQLLIQIADNRVAVYPLYNRVLLIRI